MEKAQAELLVGQLVGWITVILSMTSLVVPADDRKQWKVVNQEGVVVLSIILMQQNDLWIMEVAKMADWGWDSECRLAVPSFLSIGRNHIAAYVLHTLGLFSMTTAEVRVVQAKLFR